MKIADVLPTIKATIVRLRLVLGISLIVVLLAVGGAYGWKTYKHRQSPEFTLQNLNKALLTNNKEELSKLVDFRSLATNLATNIYAQRPQTPMAGTRDQSVVLLSDDIQRMLLAALDTPKDDKAPPPVPAETPLAPLPADFSAQFNGKLTLQSKKEGAAFAMVNIRYARVEKDFPLMLLIEDKADGWRVTRLANAEELAKLFVQAEQHLQNQRDQALSEKNAQQLDRMTAQLEVRSCSAAIQQLSDKKTVLLTAQFVALNKGPHTIHNMNLVANFTAKSTPELRVERRINIAVRMPPGEHITHTYNTELQLDKTEDAALAAAGALECTLSPNAMALSSGEVLYLRVKPTP